jgi:AcrR family transcriptional regulator
LAASSDKARARRKTPQDRRQDLLAVAVTCLAELGPRGATGREICRQAGVSHGLLRHYFETPEALFLEAYRGLCDRFLTAFDARLADDGRTPQSALDAFFEAQFSADWANPDILGAWIAFWTLTRTDPAFAVVNEAYNRRLGDLLDQALRRLPPSALDPAEAAKILLATMDGLWLEVCLRPDTDKRAEAVALCRTTLRRLSIIL